MIVDIHTGEGLRWRNGVEVYEFLDMLEFGIQIATGCPLSVSNPEPKFGTSTHDELS